MLRPDLFTSLAHVVRSSRCSTCIQLVSALPRTVSSTVVITVIIIMRTYLLAMPAPIPKHDDA